MTTRKYSSRSQQTTLTSAVTSGAVTIPVVSASTLLGGATVSTGQTFTAVIDPDTALEEIVEITVVSSNNLTVTRAVDMAGGTAQDHSSGAVIRHMIIGRDLREANLHIEATGSYNDGTAAHTLHGLGSSDGVVVGTDAVQTLTNKTLTSPVLTGVGVDASIVFEGSTVDAYETTLTVVDPTADRTITLPNATGTVVLKDTVDTLTNKTLTSPTISGSPVITGLSSAGMSASSAVPKDYVDAILVLQTAQATAAATSAASAATSASSAATSASSALTSQTAASTSATSAAASATAAATSASSAAASQTAAATSASSAATSATSAATTYTAYDARYLGSKASAPTLDNQGGALITGATYWNSATSLMYAWSGSAWQVISTSSSYSAPTLGSTTIASGTTYTNITGLTINSTTIPSSKTLVVTTDKLSTLAATTSSELAGVITDETGSGSLVFATSPTLVTPNLGTPSAISLTNATNTPTDATKANLASPTFTGTVTIPTGAVITSPKIGSTYSAKTAAYTFASGDEGNIFSMNNAATQQFNIPTDATFNFAVGTEINVFWITGAGQPTIGAVTPGTTTVISTGATSATPKLRVANSGATIKKLAANSWIVFGDLA